MLTNCASKTQNFTIEHAFVVYLLFLLSFLLRLSRKPTPRCVRDIGAWYAAFSVTSVISVMTNCALMHGDSSLRAAFSPDSSDLGWLLLLVAVEHAFLLVRVVIDRLINDVPRSVKDAQDREEFILSERRKEGKGK